APHAQTEVAHRFEQMAAIQVRRAREAHRSTEALALDVIEHSGRVDPGVTRHRQMVYPRGAGFRNLIERRSRLDGEEAVVEAGDLAPGREHSHVLDEPAGRPDAGTAQCLQRRTAERRLRDGKDEVGWPLARQADVGGAEQEHELLLKPGTRTVLDGKRPERILRARELATVEAPDLAADLTGRPLDRVGDARRIADGRTHDEHARRTR